MQHRQSQERDRVPSEKKNQKKQNAWSVEADTSWGTCAIFNIWTLKQLQGEADEINICEYSSSAQIINPAEKHLINALRVKGVNVGKRRYQCKTVCRCNTSAILTRVQLSCRRPCMYTFQGENAVWVYSAQGYGSQRMAASSGWSERLQTCDTDAL